MEYKDEWTSTYIKERWRNDLDPFMFDKIRVLTGYSESNCVWNNSYFHPFILIKIKEIWKNISVEHSYEDISVSNSKNVCPRK